MTRTLVGRFAAAFDGALPGEAVRAPGRVNLIGEHTDYNGYPVLPTAIDRSIRVVFRTRPDLLARVANVSDRFPPRAFVVNEIPGKFPPGDWCSYILAAVRGVLEEFHPSTPRGFDALFAGDIPVAAGLSSSSALVVAAALVFLHVCGIPYDRLALAEALARAERYAGIEGGGMDQAVSLLARDGCALRIDFFPLRVRPVPFPKGVHIVVCDSLVEAAKTAGARLAYNTRVVECRLAAALIAREYERRTGLRAAVGRIADLDDLFAGHREQMREACVGAALHGDVLPLGEIASRLDMNPERVLQTYCRTRGGETLAPPPAGFAVGPRYRHVVSEAARVEEAERALGRGDARRFGELMNASHASCRDAYEVSCGELERLVARAREAGALGARLTGAGFGGCTVNLVASGNLASFLRAMRGMYSGERAAALGERGITAHDAVFVCRPAAGASVLAVTGDEAWREGST